jgi:hypothetical protein
MISRKKTLIVLSFFILSMCSSLCLFFFFRPSVYRHVTSPKGTWSVTVLRKRVSPFIEGVDVIVRVEDKDGRILFQETIDRRDLWSDVEMRYPTVLIDEQRILIGPHYWDANQFFTLDKSDLELGNRIPTLMKSEENR